MTDAFYYSGPIARGADLDFIKHVLTERRSSDAKESNSDNGQSDRVLLVMATMGGDPDAAYKISRFLQEHYDHFTVIVPSMCKSAGTLLAVGAEELAFCPYGELGPLDVQINKADEIVRLESGLNIDEAFRTLEYRAIDMFHTMIQQITTATRGVVTFPTASGVASGFSSSLYGQVLGKIDPEEVGSRARAMRVGEEYCARLNKKFENLREMKLRALSRTYPNHGFVIDMREARDYFKIVREATEYEKTLFNKVEEVCIWPRMEPIFGTIPVNDGENEDGNKSDGE